MAATLDTNSKKIQRNSPSSNPSSLKSLHWSNKILLFGMLFFLLVGTIVASGKFLGISHQRPEYSLHGQGDNNSPSGNLPEASRSGEDVYVGPVRLPDSSYITKELDSYNKEQSDVTQEEVPDVSSSSYAPRYSLADVIRHPLQTGSTFISSLRISWENDNRRSTLIKLVDSVSRYFVSFRTFPPEQIADDEYGWVAEMVNKREMSGVYEYVLRTTAPVAYCGTSLQTGYCYQSDGQNAIIYVRLEKYSDAEVCNEGDEIFFLWSSADNRLGSVCLSEEPTQLQDFTFIRY